MLWLNPASRFSGEITLPGSKSLSNRALLLAALARGRTRLMNLLESDDVAVMSAALTQLGVGEEGCAGPLPGGEQRLFLGNAGTAMRPLCAALTASSGSFTLEGEPRMAERPIGPLVEALRGLGARLTYLEAEGYPPLRVEGPSLQGGRTSVDGTLSSQFLTALLMAAPLAREPVEIEVLGELVSLPYVEMTLAVMERFGVRAHREGLRQVRVEPQVYQSPGEFLVEGDASSASYFLAGAAIKGGPVRVRGVGRLSLQGDSRFAEVLEKMGATVSWGPDWIEVSGGRGLRGLEVDLKAMPDAAMTLATAALFAEGPTTIRNVANWRVKETDRLAAMACELRKLGARVEELPDGLTIEPPVTWMRARIETYRDHRMAMAFSLASLGPVAVEIVDPDCTSKTFPGYFREFARLCG